MAKKKKSKKVNIVKKTPSQIALEYLRTAAYSFLAALIFTVLLSFHARSEMIKNLYANKADKLKIDVQLAKQLVMQSDFMKDLRKKNYNICMQVGILYESASDYQNAEMAYRLALEKAKPKNYNPYARLTSVLIAQDKFPEAKELLNSVKDVSDKNLIKYKARSYIEMGDKLYSKGKFLSAARCYEKSKYYYDRFQKKDKIVEKSILDRISNAYVETADIMVKNARNSDAVNFLKKAEHYAPDNFNIKYKLAIVYSDLDPIKSVEYFEPILKERPQDIDYGVYSKALMKAATIEELQKNHTKSKYYRYKIHSVDLFVNQKVVYKNDLEILLDKFVVRKLWFKYHLEGTFRFKNVSANDINKLSAEFVFRHGDKILDTVPVKIVGKTNPLYSNGGVTEEVKVSLGKNIFTKKELEQYVIDIYLYKDKKYKTYISTMKVPLKSVYNTNK